MMYGNNFERATKNNAYSISSSFLIELGSGIVELSSKLVIVGVIFSTKSFLYFSCPFKIEIIKYTKYFDRPVALFEITSIA